MLFKGIKILIHILKYHLLCFRAENLDRRIKVTNLEFNQAMILEWAKAIYTSNDDSIELIWFHVFIETFIILCFNRRVFEQEAKDFNFIIFRRWFYICYIWLRLIIILCDLLSFLLILAQLIPFNLLHRWLPCLKESDIMKW